MSEEAEPPHVTKSVGNRRWFVPLALFVSLLVGFLDRLNLSLALPQMAEENNWTVEEVGNQGTIILGVFFIGYGLSNIFLTPFAARFGVRRSLMGVVVLFSLFTALGAPLAAWPAAFIATRLCLGLSEGVHFPMMSTATKAWFPMHERSRANGIWIMGAMLATILAPILLVPIIHQFGWRTMLVISGSMGLLFTLPALYFFVHDSPESDPNVSTEEVDYIRAGLEVDEDDSGSWAFLANKTFWLAVIISALANYATYGVLNWLPIYFTEAKGVEFADLKFAASIPYLVGIGSITLYAVVGDRFNKRILMAAGGFLFATVGMLLATQATNVPITILAFSVAVFFMTAYTSQEFAIIQRILPHASISKGVGVYNGTAILLGAVGGVMLIGQIVAITGSYDAGMLSVVVALLLNAVLMFILSRRVNY